MLELQRRKRHRDCEKTVEDVIERAEGSSESIIVTLAASPNEIVYANTAWEALCGWSLKEVKGRTCKLLQGPQTCTRALRDLEVAISRRQSVRVQLRNYRKDGAVFSNDLLMEPLTSRGRHGIITHLQGTLRQISDDELIPKARPPKFDAQAEAKTEAELLRKLQEQQPTTLAEAMLQTRYAQVITEPAAPYRIVAVNREWCDTCGFSSEEAIGETCGMLQGPGTCRDTLKAISVACEARTTLAFKLLNYTKKRYPFISLLLLSPLRDRNDEVVYLIGTTQPRFLDPDSPELQPAPSRPIGAGHLLGHSAAAEGGTEHACSPLSPALPPPRLKEAHGAGESSPAAATDAATDAATAALQPPNVPTPPRPPLSLTADPDARPPPPLQADLDLVEFLPCGELDEIATLMQLQPWRVSPPRQRAAGDANSANQIHAALTAAIYDREAEACAAAAQATQAAAAAEPALQRSSVLPLASYGATESQLRVESAAALRAAWLYGLGPVESSAAMQTANALLPVQHLSPHRLARSDHPPGGGGSGGCLSGGASQPMAAAAACDAAAHFGRGAGVAFGGGGGGAEATALGDVCESRAVAATAAAVVSGCHGDASAAFGGGAASVVPAATWFAQAQAQAQMLTQMQTQQMQTQQMQMQTQPSVACLLEEIQRGSAALAHVHSGVSGTFARGACGFGPGGGGCDSVTGVGHSVLHGGGLSIASAALGPASDWLCASPVAVPIGAQGSGKPVGGGTCLSPCGAAAGGAAAPNGAGGGRAGAVLVQQRYRECEQMLVLLEAAVLQLDARYRCRAAPLPTLPPPATLFPPAAPSPLQPWPQKCVR